MQKFKESVIFREAAYYGRNIGICGVGGQRDACPAPQSTKENPESRKAYRKYSLGMKQRLGIAAAVMEHPELILLDEPTNALDVDGVSMVKEIIQKEKDRGALIILCCHDSEVLNALADEVYHIQEGKLASHRIKEETA